MEIREPTVEDAEAIRAVHRASIEGLGPQAYDRRQVTAWARGCRSADYAATIEAAETVCLVADRDGEVIGFGTLRAVAPDGYVSDPDGEVTAVYVSPAVAREGVGTGLYAAIERRARSRSIETLGLSASLNAVPFYQAQGYDRIREYDHEFSSHEGTGVTGTIVEMTKKL
ncbi:N-acetyltransferase [Halobacteriales archaeon QH_10_67_13]|nr:MAG: N-acetyltransferase [Halobacteriales archaeon QH_10_67_13]